MDAKTLVAWLTAAANAVREQRDALTRLDAAIGDGDHGVNLSRGLDAVAQTLAGDDAGQADRTPGAVLITAGRTLVSATGGASGPLWGSAMRRAGRTLGDAPTFDGAALLAALDAAVAGIVDLGGAQPGDKTMLDAFVPAVQAFREALDAGQPVAEGLSAAALAAEAGAQATIPLQARKGRASYLGERSIGHQDPGATSTALMLRALAQVVAGETSTTGAG
ncbi:MAG TPA: dihydroxyacetone kinase subunit DhaL [Chloroflexota bacterium]|nr:dihydroxyacetone kinase subunit DhaL [Chloroflexota bacterium]